MKTINLLDKVFFFIYIAQLFNESESNSIGRVPAFQAGCCEFEPRLSLKKGSMLFEKIRKPV